MCVCVGVCIRRCLLHSTIASAIALAALVCVLAWFKKCWFERETLLGYHALENKVHRLQHSTTQGRRVDQHKQNQPKHRP